MFCPKCGTKNPDDGKFCRSCGVDLGNVSLALSGGLSAKMADPGFGCGSGETLEDARRRSDPNEVYGDSVKAIVSGIGFLVVSMSLLFTGVAGGKAWWWAMLFPAFTFLAKGISDLMKSRRMAQTASVGFAPASGNNIGMGNVGGSLPPPQTQFVSPESRYRTGDLVPPSVTDNTTRHLEMNGERETMALPKK